VSTRPGTRGRWRDRTLLAVAVLAAVSAGATLGLTLHLAPGLPAAPFAPVDRLSVSPDCAKLHPADLIPARVAERDWNVYCSSQHRPAVPAASGGSGPPGFGIYNLAMTYDAHDGYVLLLGATGVGPLNGTETWGYVGDTWFEISSTSSPESCLGSALTYDDVDGYVVYFGGANLIAGSNCTSAGETWTFAAGQWTERFPSASPPARVGAAFTNDSSDGYLLLFGGVNSTGGFLNDTWTYAGGTWTELFTTMAPSVRSGAGMTYDAYDGYVVLFGGSSNVYCTDQEQDRLFCMDRDTWSFHAGVWTLLSPVGAVPPEPYDDSLTYDAAAKDAFYTVTDDNFSSDPEIWWTFQGGNWTDPYGNAGYPVYNGTAPQNRFGEALAYDYADGYDLLFGGTAIRWNWLNDTWAYQGGSWVLLSPQSGGGPPTYPVTFRAIGIPGLVWAVNLSGAFEAGNGSSPLTFLVTNGTYNFSVLPVTGFVAEPSKGVVVVNGGGVLVNISFSPSPPPVAVYNVTFVEQGLPDGTVWTIDLAGTYYQGYSSFTLSEPNGTYDWSLLPVPGYNSTLSPEPIVVRGGPVTAYLNFTRAAVPPYLVSFIEGGLPVGATWWVQLDSSVSSSAGTTVHFSALPGNHSFYVSGPVGYRPAPASGTLDVVGPVVVEVYFTPAAAAPAFPVNVSEQGLPAGEYWTISIGGFGYSATQAWITTNLSNGSYPYSPGQVSGYFASPASGVLTVAGRAIVLEITYTAYVPCCPGIHYPEQNNATFWQGIDIGIVGGFLLGAVIVGAALWLGRRASPPVRRP